MKKYFRRLIATALTVGSLMLMPITHASVETYVGTGEYFMNTSETFNDAKNQAKLLAERNVLESISFYLTEHSSLVDGVLEEDEIILIVAGIMNITDVKYDLTSDDDENFVVKAEVTAEVDADEALKLVEREVEKRRLKNREGST